MLHVTAGVPVIGTLHTAVHPLASVTVTLYVPAVKPLTVVVVAPVFQKYVYGDVPPLTNTATLPLDCPHVSLFPVTLHIGALGVVKVTLHTVVQPLASDTVTLYVPAPKLLAVAVVWIGLVLHT